MSSSARAAATTSYVHASRPGALPVLGHLPALARDPAGFLRRLNDHGDLVEIRLGPNRLVVPCHPELLRQVYADDRTFDRGGPIYQRFRQILGNGLATCAHADHRRQRRMLQPEFRPERLASYTTAMTREAALPAGSWRHGEVVEVFPACYRFTLRVVTRTLLGTEVPDGLADRLQHAFETAFAGALRRVLLLPAGPGHQAALRTMRRTVTDLVRERRAGCTCGCSNGPRADRAAADTPSAPRPRRQATGVGRPCPWASTARSCQAAQVCSRST